MGPQSLGYFNHTFNMGKVEGSNDSRVCEKEGGTRETKSNFADDGKCPNLSYPKITSSKSQLIPPL